MCTLHNYFSIIFVTRKGISYLWIIADRVLPPSDIMCTLHNYFSIIFVTRKGDLIFVDYCW